MDADDTLAAGEDDVEGNAGVPHPELALLSGRIEEEHSLGWMQAFHLHEAPALRGRRERQPDFEPRPDRSIRRKNGSAAPRQTIQRRIASRAPRRREKKDRHAGREPRPRRSAQEVSFPPARESM